MMEEILISSSWIEYLCFVVLGVLIGLLWRLRVLLDDGESEWGNAGNGRALLSKALYALHCMPVWDDSKEKAWFEYQGGRFWMRLMPDSPYVQLEYRLFYETKAAEMDRVREVCNFCNLRSGPARLVYTVDMKKGSIGLHILDSVPLLRRRTEVPLRQALDAMFSWRHAFLDMMADSKLQTVPDDSEKRAAMAARERCLLREMEVEGQEGTGEWYHAGNDPQTLRQLLCLTLDLTDVVPVELASWNDGRPAGVMTDPDAILDCHYADGLWRDGCEVPSEVLQRLCYYDPRRPLHLRRVVIMLTREEDHDGTPCCRATLMRVPVDGEQGVGREVPVCSVRIGQENVGADKLRARYEYVRKEAEAKVRSASPEDVLTEEEQMVASASRTAMGLEIYRARMLFLQSRYYEALSLLENVYQRIIRLSWRRQRDMQETSYEVCYQMGVCYSKLHLYDRALYYLSLCLPSRRLVYREAYVSALVGARDRRALELIDAMLSEVLALFANEDDDEGAKDEQLVGEAMRYVSFLWRSKATVLIDQRQYKEAETLLQSLLADPHSRDFALRKLDSLKKLRGGKRQGRGFPTD